MIACGPNPVYPVCPNNGLIKVEYANYGRTAPDPEVCAYSSHKNVITCSQHEEAYLEHAKSLCEMKNSCHVTVLSSLGDPCYGTYKYLEVRFHCVGKYQNF